MSTYTQAPYYTVNAFPSTSGGYLISAPATCATSTATGTVYLMPHSLDVKGSAKFQTDVEIVGDLKIQGKSIAESLDAIERRLAILHPNEELEEKWDQLRGLRQMYMELEAEIKEKEAMWSILKK
jgi:hypothetical protein